MLEHCSQIFMLLTSKTRLTGYDIIPHGRHWRDTSRDPEFHYTFVIHPVTMYLFSLSLLQTWSFFPNWDQRAQRCTWCPQWDLSVLHFSPHHPEPVLWVGLGPRPDLALEQTCQRCPPQPSRSAQSCRGWCQRLGELPPLVRSLSDSGGESVLLLCGTRQKFENWSER